MKIIALSDLHGDLILNIPKCDVICICGDILPLDIQANHRKSRKWIRESFIPWTNKLECDKVILIAGNHDFVFDGISPEKIDDWFVSTKIIYLDNEEYHYNRIKFFGTPYCKVFGNWAFMRTPEILKSKFDEIPNDIDILLTHDAPYGVSDICYQDVIWNTHEHIGNPQLADAILEKKPKYNLHGHLHSTNHNCEYLGDTAVYNVSIKNENYDVAYYPFELEIEEKC